MRKKRRMGRPRGRVYLHGRTWWIKYSDHGRRVRENSGSAEEQFATDLLKQRLAEADLRGGPPIAGRVTFEQLVQLLQDDYVARNNRSWERAEYAVARLREQFGRKKASEITVHALDTYVTARLKSKVPGGTLSRGTVKLELAALRRMFSLAVAKRMVRADDVPSFPSLESGNRRKGFFERRDFERVLHHLPEHLGAPALFAYFTGMRKGEVLGLQWKQVDTDVCVIRLEETKTGEPRTLAYAKLPELASVIRRQDEARKALLRETGRLCPWVFWHRDGQPIRDFYGAWRTACKAAAVPGRLFHDLRRTAVRNLVRAGVPDTVAMAITGHSTRSVFDRYNITSESDIADALGRLAGMGAVSGTNSGTMADDDATAATDKRAQAVAEKG